MLMVVGVFFLDWVILSLLVGFNERKAQGVTRRVIYI